MKEIIRQPEVVESFQYRLKTEEEQELTTNIQVGVHPFEVIQPEGEATVGDSIIGVRIEYVLVFDHFLIVGSVHQNLTIRGKEIREPADCSNEEIDEYVQPLLSVIKRLTYEVTEIALDQPGIELNFEQPDEA